MNESPTSSFTLADVLKDALASVRASWVAHVLWGMIFLALLFASCCGVTCLLVPLAAVLGAGAPESASSSPVLLVAVYVLLGVAYFALFTLHEGVTLELTFAHARGEAVSLRHAIDATLRRAPALAGAALLRMLGDLVVPGLLLSLGAGVLASATDTGSESARVVAGVAVTIGYFASLAWLLVARAYFGLAVPAVVHGGLGPRAAFEKSLALLRGRRAHFVAFRLACFAFGLGLYCLSSVPLFVAAGLDPGALDRAGDDIAALFGLAVLVGVYVLMLALYAVDSILVGSYHARLARPVDSASLAKIFE